MASRPSVGRTFERIADGRFRRELHPATGRGFYGSLPDMHSRRWILVPFRGAPDGNFFFCFSHHIGRSLRAFIPERPLESSTVVLL